MKIHKYQITVYEGALDWIHGGGQTQDRLYVPGQGVIGYRRDYKNEKNIDAFCGKPEDIAEAEECIKGQSKIEGGVKYLGEIDLPDEEKMFLIDYKTINPFDYKDLTAPKIEHVTQLQIYFYLSGLKYGKVIYENKATQAVKEFNICRDDALIEVKKEEAIRLKYQLTNVNSTGKHVLPQRGYDSRGHKKCLDCKYRGHCWNAL
jgi:hypothetical protein